MKKRFVCFLLTLVMLVSLVPAAALTASAASYGVSSAAITVLKKMVQYNRYCYRVGDSSEFRIGYGTLCTGNHKWVEVQAKDNGADAVTLEVLADVKSNGSINVFTQRKTVSGVTGDSIVAKDGAPRFTSIWSLTYNGKPVNYANHYMGESAADAALRKSLAEIDKKVDSFASSNNVTLNQNKHDALVLLTYLTGSAWMSGTNATKTAIINNASSAELLSAMEKNYGSNNSDAEARSKVLVNMYMNGVYANVAPTYYAKVKYNPDGGTIPGFAPGTEYEYTFDANRVIGHPVIPTMKGYTFIGWYLPGNSNNSALFMPKLTGDCAGKTLVAKWQKNDSNSTSENVILNGNLSNGVVYEHPWASEVKGNVAGYAKIKISASCVDNAGAKWAQIAGGNALYNAGEDKWVSSGVCSGKWVQLNEAVSFTPTDAGWSVSQLRSRDLYAGPNTWAVSDYDLKKSVTSVTAKYEYVDASGVRWACIDLAHEGSSPVTASAAIYKDGKTSGSAANYWVRLNTGANGGVSLGAASGAVAKATITAQGYVNVRSAAGTNNPIVGSVRKNETVDVFEIVTCNGHKWGRINGGWICLTYASVTLLQADADVDVSSEGALAYTYSGFVSPNSGYVDEVYVSPKENSNKINENYRKTLTNNTSVTVTNMTLSPDQTELWVKIRWTANYKDKLGNNQSALATGWVKITDNNSNKGYSTLPTKASVTLGASSNPIQLWPVRYTVSADEITVRNAPGSGEGIAFKMNKGVQFEAWEFCLVGEEIWGFCREVTDVNDKYQGENVNSYISGWVNLSSKYVSRTDLPAVAQSQGTGMYATIVNCTAARVRVGAGLYNRAIGTLPAGTKANILEYDEENGWYNLDVDVDGDPETGSWVFEQYVETATGSMNDSQASSNGVTTTNPDGTKTTVSSVSKGIVANTYAGVNVRQGPGIGHAQVGKLLPGTPVDIYEVQKSGTSDWGRIDKGWVCMDYITLLSTTTTTTTTNSGNGTGVTDFATLDKTTTTAVYTGSVVTTPDESSIIDPNVQGTTSGLHVWAAPKHNQDPNYYVFALNSGDPVTIYELLSVTEQITNNNTGDDAQNEDADGNGHGLTKEETVTSYWARTSDGYIFNPQDNLTLSPLDEVYHTLTGSDTLNVRDTANGNVVGELKKGDQVKVTNLKIVNDKVWGEIEYEYNDEYADENTHFTYGWVRLDYFSEGAYYIEKAETSTNTVGNANVNNTMGNTGNTYSGGFVTGTNGGYRYTGKVINTNAVNVRQNPSTTAAQTTSLKSGDSLVIYETTINENMAWGRCDAGWVYLYYVDLTPVLNGAVDARVVYNDNTIIYSDSTGSSTVGTYAKMSVIDIYEIVGKMARTEDGWVNTDNLL